MSCNYEPTHSTARWEMNLPDREGRGKEQVVTYNARVILPVKRKGRAGI